MNLNIQKAGKGDHIPSGCWRSIVCIMQITTWRFNFYNLVIGGWNWSEYKQINLWWWLIKHTPKNKRQFFQHSNFKIHKNNLIFSHQRQQIRLHFHTPRALVYYKMNMFRKPFLFSQKTSCVSLESSHHMIQRWCKVFKQEHEKDQYFYLQITTCQKTDS